MTDAVHWRPSATLEALRQRARALTQVREFFATRGLLEVDTPALVGRTVTDVHIHSATVQLPGCATPLHLQTSPEYAMKRLLAAGSGDIFQIAHVFRGEECSPLHNAEFTLIEWYRCGFSLMQLMEEVAALARTILGAQAAGTAQWLRYDAAFGQELAVDPLRADLHTLRACACSRGLDPALAGRLQRDELLDWLMAVCVGPRLGRNALCFVHRYPSSQAALAALDPQEPGVALRFELYFHGIELANGFEELGDSAEQRARFAADRHERTRRGLPVPDMDERLLAALAAGLPPVAGVAVGFDRLLMLALGCERLDDVLPFTREYA